MAPPSCIGYFGIEREKGIRQHLQFPSEILKGRGGKRRAIDKIDVIHFKSIANALVRSDGGERNKQLVREREPASRSAVGVIQHTVRTTQRMRAKQRKMVCTSTSSSS